MMISICADVQGRVTGVCPDNLTGGQGWVWIETDLTPATELYNNRGIALYKKVGSVIVARTEAEIETEMADPVEPELTEIEKLQSENAKLTEMLAQTNADFAGFMDYYFSVNPE